MVFPPGAVFYFDAGFPNGRRPASAAATVKWYDALRARIPAGQNNAIRRHPALVCLIKDTQ